MHKKHKYVNKKLSIASSFLFDHILAYFLNVKHLGTKLLKQCDIDYHFLQKFLPTYSCHYSVNGSFWNVPWNHEWYIDILIEILLLLTKWINKEAPIIDLVISIFFNNCIQHILINIIFGIYYWLFLDVNILSVMSYFLGFFSDVSYCCDWKVISVSM